MLHRPRRTVLRDACVLAAVFLATPSALLPRAAGGEDPKDAGVVEKTSVRLILLDVEVADRNGRPLRGLKKEDFRLRLDQKDWPIYSVDDLCVAAEQTLQANGTTGADAPTRRASTAPPEQAALEPALYVLYFDFSQLQLDGRARAFDAARKWLRESRRPDDLVTLVGYATATGLRELAPPTRDAASLAGALDAARGDRVLVDSFADGIFNRVEECRQCVRRCETDETCFDCVKCCPCWSNARLEYDHGARSLAALKRFLSSLEEIPGRKAVLFFHENDVLFPGDFYLVPRSEIMIGSQVVLLGQVGAEATTSRAAVYPIQTGDSNFFDGLSSAAVNLGAELADFTGGRYNRAPSDLFKVADTAARARPCIYRIGFTPPDTAHRMVYEARLDAAGARIPNRYRVQFLTADDRLARKARSVLAHPESATDVSLVASIEPEAVGRTGWSLKTRLALDVNAIGLLPSSGGKTGHVDVGALLYRVGGRESREMLTGSQVRKSGGAEGFILYETTIPDAPAGEYRLTAFARSPELDLFGGADATITLPAASEGGLLGPFAAVPHRRIFLSPLPLRNEGAAETTSPAEPRAGTIPAAVTRHQRGAPLEFSTWLCPPAGGPAVSEPEVASRLTRYVARDGSPLFRLSNPRADAEGRCLRVTDAVATGELPAGRYAYHIEWRPEAAAAPRAGDLVFEIADPSAPAVTRPAEH